MNTSFLLHDTGNNTVEILSFKYSHLYDASDVERFVSYMEHKLDTIEPEINREDLRRIFIDIYANPVYTKELLAKEKATGNILL